MSHMVFQQSTPVVSRRREYEKNMMDTLGLVHPFSGGLRRTEEGKVRLHLSGTLVMEAWSSVVLPTQANRQESLRKGLLNDYFHY